MKKILILLSALLVVLTACEKQTGERQDGEREEGQYPAPKISINPDKLVFSPAGGMQQVTITSNYASWYLVNGFSAWYRGEQENHKIIITCAPSDGTEERSDKLI